MPSPFDSYYDATAADQLDQAFGLAVVLRRGQQTTASFTAAFSQVQLQAAELEDLETIGHRRTWRLPVAALIFSDTGAAFTPRAGDVLEIEAGAERHEIMPLADAPAVDLLPGGQYYLAYTKRTAEP